MLHGICTFAMGASAVDFTHLYFSSSNFSVRRLFLHIVEIESTLREFEYLFNSHKFSPLFPALIRASHIKRRLLIFCVERQAAWKALSKKAGMLILHYCNKYANATIEWFEWRIFVWRDQIYFLAVARETWVTERNQFCLSNIQVHRVH